MHDEKVIVPQECLQKILRAKAENRPIIAVGTTSLRSLESLYWLREEGADFVDQWTPYLPNTGHRTPVTGHQQFSTSLMIVPGYKLRIATGIITNFHQPKSTLLLLISAIVGNDWRNIYDYALAHDFRFLSYGDSCLLLP
jgi:S-adenosylmethionine:tRNA ribosyltransferase-isomerase